MATDDIKSAEDKKNAELEKEEYYPHSEDNENTGATQGACGCMSMDDSMDTDMTAGMDDDTDDDMDDDEGVDAILVEEEIIIAGAVDDDDMDDDGLNDDLTDTADTDPNADYRVDASLEDAVRDNLSGDDFVDSGKDHSGDAGEELSFSDDSDEKDKKDKKKDDKEDDTPDYISGDGDKVEELDDKIVSETNKLIAEKRAAHEAAHHKGCGCGKTI